MPKPNVLMKDSKMIHAGSTDFNHMIRLVSQYLEALV